MSAYAPNPTYHGNEDNYAPLTASLLARKGEATPAVDAAAHAGVDIDMAPSMPGIGPGVGPGAGSAKRAQRQRGARTGQSSKTGLHWRADAARPEPARPESFHPEPVRYGEAHNDVEPHDDFGSPSPIAHAESVEDDYNPVVYAPNAGAGDAVVDAEPVPAASEFSVPGAGDTATDGATDGTTDGADNIERFPGAAGASSPAGGEWTVSGPSIEAAPSIRGAMDAFRDGGSTGDALEDVRARLRRRARRAAEAGKAGRKATITFRMPARDLVRLRFASRELGVTCQTIILEALECYLEANDVAPVSDADFAAETDRLMRLKKEKARKRRF